MPTCAHRLDDDDEYRRFIKGRSPGKLTGCENESSLPVCLSRGKFSHKEYSSKGFPPVKTSFPSAENAYETPKRNDFYKVCLPSPVR